MNNGMSIEEEARIYLQARLLRCPFGGNPVDCPLHHIRKRPMQERYAWLEEQSDQQVVELYRYHEVCAERKLAE